jgi:hypothetical protein
LKTRTELLASLVSTALVVVGIYLTIRIDLSFSSGMNVFTGPRGYPGVILGAMLLLGLILVGKFARQLRAEPGPTSDADDRSEEGRQGKIKAAAAYLAFAVFVLVLEPLGYILAMLALLVVVARLGGARRWSVALLASFVMMLTCLLIFRYGLDTVLPEGIFGIDMIF